VEVGVDVDTGETRVRRMLAVCAAGRILNPKTVRSQVIGAMTMGVGAAFMEELAVDYNATGVRVRDYPMTLEKLLDRLPRPEGA
jgi:CO/xanthine dehydrogenase Mo-binding subunit